MIIRILLYSSILINIQCVKTKPFEYRRCLTGYMTEVQSWVDEKGVLIATEDFESAIDLSASQNPVQGLQQKIAAKNSRSSRIKYFSMARCRLTEVPGVFKFRDAKGRDLSETIQYITFYGNQFSEHSLPDDLYHASINATDPRERDISSLSQHHAFKPWSLGFNEADFPVLKELDLRACSIQIIKDDTFKRMPNLEALYMGENEIYFIETNAFAGLKNLKHLDFSRNTAHDDKGNVQALSTESVNVFEPLKNMKSLDFSLTKITQIYVKMIQRIRKLTRLSLCETGLANLEDEVFGNTSLKILDLSGNYGVFGRSGTLKGLEDTLKIIYAKDTGLRTLDIFQGFQHLEVLSVSANEISNVNPEVTKTLRKLQILDLEMNRITSWFLPTFSYLTSLKLLSLRENNINLISEEIITDIAHVKYVAMSGNFIVCNCHSRDFFDLALQNEERESHDIIIGKSDSVRGDPNAPVDGYHTAFIDFNDKIIERNEVTGNCTEDCFDIDENIEGDFVILDYHTGAYMCLLVTESRPVEFSEIEGCNRVSRDIDYDTVMQQNANRIYLLVMLPGVMMLLGFVYFFRRNFRYCLITLRNSTMLSLINKHNYIDDGTIFHYDVFVSYCNEDRSWVLQHLIPHLESDCSISACLHERDFQVGYSILENIVSCMDRSRTIMLIISQRFLLSQWCQFEMHLAQHRLLETRREDLTLVLLEEIPRQLRPNTLHYLMLTKTYIVWPNSKQERVLFWKRIKKGIITMKQRQTAIQGVSVA